MTHLCDKLAASDAAVALTPAGHFCCSLDHSHRSQSHGFLRKRTRKTVHQTCHQTSQMLSGTLARLRTACPSCIVTTELNRTLCSVLDQSHDSTGSGSVRTVSDLSKRVRCHLNLSVSAHRQSLSEESRLSRIGQCVRISKQSHLASFILPTP